MKLLKFLLPFALATSCFTSVAFADDVVGNGFSTIVEERERDFSAVTDFVNSKRALSIAEKGGALMISGDIHAEWSSLRCRNNHVRERGSGSGNLVPPTLPHPPFATNEFDIEVNLILDYKADRSWATIQFQLDNPMGIRNVPFVEGQNSNKNILWGSGITNNISMRKAFMGYNLYEEGTSRLDFEIGRRRLYDVFDSKIQFFSIFDGALLKYAQSFEGITDFTAKAAAFIVDQTVNHYGYVGELGFLNLGDSGIDFKYSLITWRRNGANRYGLKHAKGSKFVNSQLTLAYNISPDLIKYKSKVYGAFVHNHDAHGNRFTHHKKKDNAFYVGYRMGEVKKKNDWAVDLRYEWVQAQAIPERDCSGILRDNPRNISFYNSTSHGFANYRGYKIDTFYALTDNWTLNAFFERAIEQSHKIGGKHRSWMFELQAIYAF